MSKTNQAASRVTLASPHLDGYNGPLEIISIRRRSWWQRLLRRPQRYQRSMVFGDVRGCSARVWRHRR